MFTTMVQFEGSTHPLRLNTGKDRLAKGNTFAHTILRLFWVSIGGTLVQSSSVAAEAERRFDNRSLKQQLIVLRA